MYEKLNDIDMIELIGTNLYEIWKNLICLINEKYEMDNLINNGGKRWTYEYKFRRGGKTLCAMYAKKDVIGLMIIFGKDEREKFENNRLTFSKQVQNIYDNANTYHDGKWVMFEMIDNSMFEDFVKLLCLKRKPNKK